MSCCNEGPFSRCYLQNLCAEKQKKDLMDTLQPYVADIVTRVLAAAETGQTSLEYNNPNFLMCARRLSASGITIESYLSSLASAVAEKFPDTTITIDAAWGKLTLDWS